MFFRYRLIEDGTGRDLGPFASSEPNWKPGHRIQLAAGEGYEVVAFVESAEAEDISGYLAVRRV